MIPIIRAAAAVTVATPCSVAAPRAVAERLSATGGQAAIVKEPAMRERIIAQAAVPAALAGTEFGAFLVQQHELWGKVVRLPGTRLD